MINLFMMIMRRENKEIRIQKNINFKIMNKKMMMMIYKI